MLNRGWHGGRRERGREAARASLVHSLLIMNTNALPNKLIIEVLFTVGVAVRSTDAWNLLLPSKYEKELKEL